MIQNWARIDRLLMAVKIYYIDNIDKIRGKTKPDYIVRIRHIMMYIMREHYKMSYPNIGEFFNRDHSTALSAVKKVKAKINLNKDFEKEINDLINKL